jgi:hypothetical protein
MGGFREHSKQPPRRCCHAPCRAHRQGARRHGRDDRLLPDPHALVRGGGPFRLRRPRACAARGPRCARSLACSSHGCAAHRCSDRLRSPVPESCLFKVSKLPGGPVWLEGRWVQGVADVAFTRVSDHPAGSQTVQLQVDLRSRAWDTCRRNRVQTHYDSSRHEAPSRPTSALEAAGPHDPAL